MSSHLPPSDPMRTYGPYTLKLRAAAAVVMLLAAGYAYLSLRPDPRRLRNEQSAREILVACHAYLGGQEVYLPDSLDDLLRHGSLAAAPLYQAASGQRADFGYLGGSLSLGDNGFLVLLAAPEAEPDGTVLVGRFNATTDYLPSAEASAELEKTRLVTVGRGVKKK